MFNCIRFFHFYNEITNLHSARKITCFNQKLIYEEFMIATSLEI